MLAAALLAGAAVADPVPSLWDPALHLDKPDLTGLKAIRFLTADDYPPLDFALPDGSLSGFNVEIARAVCEQLRLPCTIQARRWDTLVEALETGKGDAMIASMRATPALRARLAFTHPYYLTPARFAARKDFPQGEIDAKALAGKTVGVVKGSAHERFLTQFFAEAKLKSYGDFAALLRALKAGEIDLAFADGLTLGDLARRRGRRRLLRLSRRAVSGEPLFRRGRVGRGAQGRRCVAPHTRLRARPRMGEREIRGNI